MAELYCQASAAFSRLRIHNLRILPAGSADINSDSMQSGADRDVLQCQSTLLDFVPFEKQISHTPWTSSRKEQITVVKELTYIIWAPLRKCSEREFKVSVQNKRCLDALLSWCRTVATLRD